MARNTYDEVRILDSRSTVDVYSDGPPERPPSLPSQASGSSEDVRSRYIPRTVQIAVPDYKDILLAAFQSQRVEPSLTDGCLVVKNYKKYKVHRFLVSSFSKVLAEAFLNDSSGVVVIDDIDEEIMGSLLDFMYQNMALVNENRLLEFLTAARKLQIECLQTRGLVELERRLMDSSASEIPNLPPSLSITRMENKKKTIDVNNSKSDPIVSSVKSRTGEPTERSSEEKPCHCCCPCSKSEKREAKEEIDEERVTIAKKLKQCGTSVTGSGVNVGMLDLPAWFFSSQALSIAPVKGPPPGPSKSNSSSPVSQPGKSPPQTPSSSNKYRPTQVHTPSPYSEKSKSLPIIPPPYTNSEEPVVLSHTVASRVKRNLEPRLSGTHVYTRGALRRQAANVFGRNPNLSQHVRGRGRGFVTDNRQQSLYNSRSVLGEQKVTRRPGRPGKYFTGQGRAATTPIQYPSQFVGHYPGQLVPKSSVNTVAGIGRELDIIDTGITINLLDSAAEVIQNPLTREPCGTVNRNVVINNPSANTSAGCQQPEENERKEATQMPPLKFGTVYSGSEDSGDLRDLTERSEVEASASFEGFKNTSRQKSLSEFLSSGIPLDNKDSTTTDFDAQESVDQVSHDLEGKSSHEDQVRQDVPEVAEDRNLKDGSSSVEGLGKPSPNMQLKVLLERITENDENSPRINAEGSEAEAVSQSSLKPVVKRKVQTVQECMVCQKKLSNKSSLDMHMLIHQKERPFYCSSCPFRTEVLRKMKMHVSRKHSRDVIDTEKERKDVAKVCEAGNKLSKIATSKKGKKIGDKKNEKRCRKIDSPNKDVTEMDSEKAPGKTLKKKREAEQSHIAEMDYLQKEDDSGVGQETSSNVDTSSENPQAENESP